MSKIKKIYKVTGLDCANCGAKIQDKIAAFPEVESCNLDFVMGKMIVKINTDNINKENNKDLTKKEENELNTNLENTIVINAKDKTEDDNQCCAGHSHEEKHEHSHEECECDSHSHNDGHDHSHEGCDGHSHDDDISDFEVNLEAYRSGFDEKVFLKKINKVADKIEPGAKFSNFEKNSVEEEDSGIKRKLDLAKIVMALILFFVAMFMDTTDTIKLSIYAVAYLLVGLEVIVRALKNILRGEIFDENFLMTIATIGAFLIKEYPEGVIVMLFYQIGEYVQEGAVADSKKSIKSLMNIKPEFANIKVGNDIKTVDPSDVKIGDIMVVKPGEKLPIDGVVVEGVSNLNTAAITGESLPLDVEEGSKVLSGSINISGLIYVKTTTLYEDSTVAKILDMVENASSKKAKAEKFITKFARYYTPLVVMIAAIIAILPPIFIEGAVFSEWVYRALIFLVISCPCALVISIPLGFFGGIGGASKNGILIKGGNYLEVMNSVDTVVFDKTGTLTKGSFKVEEIVPFENRCTEFELLELATYGESFSNHPIAKSIVEFYSKNVDKSKVTEYQEIPGFGITARVYGRKVAVGNHRLMDKLGVEYKQVELVGSIIYVVADNRFMGRISIIDEIKPEASDAIKELKRMGIRTVMLTGDNQGTGSKVAAKLGINKFFAELLPQDKVTKLESLKRAKGKLMFVGDGINDAPALAMADIGVAMGGLGADAAVEVADVVIMNDDISKVATAIKIAKKTNNIVWQNIIIAFGVKLIVLLLGTVGLASIWEAVFADVGVAIIAIFNAKRAMK